MKEIIMEQIEEDNYMTLHEIIFYISEIEDIIKDYDMAQFYKDKKAIYACFYCINQINSLIPNLSTDIIEKDEAKLFEECANLKSRIIIDNKIMNLNILWDFISKKLEQLNELIDNIKNEDFERRLDVIKELEKEFDKRFGKLEDIP